MKRKTGKKGRESTVAEMCRKKWARNMFIKTVKEEMLAKGRIAFL